MYSQYHEIVETRAHYMADALREVEQDRLADDTESAQPHKPRFYSYIAAYLRGKLHYHVQPGVNNPESHPAPSAAGVE